MLELSLGMIFPWVFPLSETVRSTCSPHDHTSPPAPAWSPPVCSCPPWWSRSLCCVRRPRCRPRSPPGRSPSGRTPPCWWCGRPGCRAKQWSGTSLRVRLYSTSTATLFSRELFTGIPSLWTIVTPSTVGSLCITSLTAIPWHYSSLTWIFLRNWSTAFLAMLVVLWLDLYWLLPLTSVKLYKWEKFCL